MEGITQSHFGRSEQNITVRSLHNNCNQKNAQTPHYKKSSHRATHFYTFYTNEELSFNMYLLWKKAQASDWKPLHGSFVIFAQEQLK